MDILLIRHGDTEPISRENFSQEKNRPDPPLSALGEKQAALLGRSLIGRGVQALYASDLIRAVRTATIIGESLGLPVEQRAALREIDMGRVHHCGWEDIRREDPDFAERWHGHREDLAYPGGESGADVEQRLVGFLNEIMESGLDKAAVVTHGGVIRVAVCAALAIGHEKRFLLGPPENTSITVLRYDRGRGEFGVYSMNEAGHLE